MKVCIQFECGEKTCAIKPGKFCRFLETSSFGTKWFCGLFNIPLLDGEDGWLLRCPQCLAEVKEINE